jgi:hypothetical protein
MNKASLATNKNRAFLQLGEIDVDLISKEYT